jgi:dihydroneopterin aldolase
MKRQAIADAALGVRHVFVHDLVLAAQIGVYPEEHGRTQRVRLNVDLAVRDDGAQPLSRVAVGRDELARVVDYSRIVAAIRAIVAAGHVRLVETLAERIAEVCLADARILSARIRVEKLDIYPDAAGVGVEIERRQADLVHLRGAQ